MTAATRDPKPDPLTPLEEQMLDALRREASAQQVLGDITHFARAMCEEIRAAAERKGGRACAATSQGP